MFIIPIVLPPATSSPFFFTEKNSLSSVSHISCGTPLDPQNSQQIPQSHIPSTLTVKTGSSAKFPGSSTNSYRPLYETLLISFSSSRVCFTTLIIHTFLSFVQYILYNSSSFCHFTIFLYTLSNTFHRIKAFLYTLSKLYAALVVLRGKMLYTSFIDRR